jgi:transcriptional regulator with XRE-family HTH domain
MKQTRPPVEAGGHPDCDEVYERVLREHFAQAQLDDDFVREVVKRFKKAPTALFCGRLGTWVGENLERLGWRQQDLADRLGVDRAAVSCWAAGRNITTDNFAALVVVFKAPWSELPFPARQQLAVAAYRAALSYIREKLDPTCAARELDAERFWCLFHLFAEPHWERAIRRQDPDLLRREADRVLAAVGQSLGHRPRGVVGAECLKQLLREWGLAWLVCVKMPSLARNPGQVPKGWAVR